MDLWEVLRPRGWDPLSGITALMKQAPEGSLAPFIVPGHSDKGAGCEPETESPAEPKQADTLISGFQLPEQRAIDLCL